jgi:predicted transcriptional regulator
METKNRSRDKVRLLVALMPGIHLRRLQRLTGMSFSSTRYHVHRLKETGHIVREEDGGYSRLYPSGTTPDERMIFSLLRRETNRRIIVCLTQHPALTNKEIVHLTGLAKSTISRRLGHLVSVGIVEIKLSDNEGILYQVKEPDRISSLMTNKKDTLLAKATGRFIDVWDF